VLLNILQGRIGLPGQPGLNGQKGVRGDTGLMVSLKQNFFKEDDSFYF
jgi:hypothetical protein